MEKGKASPWWAHGRVWPWSAAQWEEVVRKELSPSPNFRALQKLLQKEMLPGVDGRAEH